MQKSLCRDVGKGNDKLKGEFAISIFFLDPLPPIVVYKKLIMKPDLLHVYTFHPFTCFPFFADKIELIKLQFLKS